MSHQELRLEALREARQIGRGDVLITAAKYAAFLIGGTVPGKTPPVEAPLDRPNHFFHDSHGCPFLCTDDHNHPSKGNTK